MKSKTSLKALLAASASISLLHAAPASAAEPITILINTSPWYGAFEAVVAKYEEDTGNTVNIDAVPIGGLLEKARNATRTETGDYDIVNLANGWIIEFYEEGLLAPLDEIDPDFALSEATIDADEIAYWNAEKGWPTKDGGRLMTFLPNANVHLWFYRNDLVDTAPATWEEVMETCQAVHNPPDVYGTVLRGARGNAIRFNFSPYMLSFGGSIVRNPEEGDFTVTFNSPEVHSALEYYIGLAEACGPDNPGAIDQGEMIQYIVTSKGAMAGVIVGATAQMDDPEKSIVTGRMDYATMPHPEGGSPNTVWGSWQMGVPANATDAGKQGAMEFIRYFLQEDTQEYYAEAGGIPVNRDVLTGELSEREEYRWMTPYAETSEFASQLLLYPEGAEVEEIIGIRLNQALIGELSVTEALNRAAEEIHEVFERSGRNTGMLDPLQ